MKSAVCLFIAIAFLSCKSDKSSNASENSKIPSATINDETLQLSYAKGFSVKTFENFSVLNVSNPWPNADESYKYALIPRENAAKITLNKEDFDGMLLTPIQSIVVTSTTHIPALELLGVEQSLVGFPGINYISSEKVRARIDQGHVRELGKNEGINTEVLLEVRPDVVIAFGVDGSNKSMDVIAKAGIPVIYNGDWVEKSPLAKAEWIKFFGVLYNKQKKADSIFNQIVTGYEEAKKLATTVNHVPTILAGAMYKDVWYLPSGTSPEAQFLNDANLNYLWRDTEGKGSLELSFESVFQKAKNAELWLSPSYYTSLEAMLKANTHYDQFEAYKNKSVYSFASTVGATGGVTYYELGMARPDLVLKDMIKIGHPELLEDYELNFFRKMK
ncbi:ABC transporter substrate-binding protein [Subsaximicrobium wynnwilliamsii]|uniref:ABC transporter substrate-binding protein n=1 Tax=Subsaximicrobium wynnwilliamsii TaxID=291179 RepID=UPI001CB8BA3E|nr:ABC transporter substrate-binding protein [Subsaximicrobium wynnwilliamsii]